MIHLSLNNGKSLFHYNLKEDDIHYIWISKSNNYLYFPSGRYLKDYKYFNYATGLYSKLYDSIAFVSLY